MVVVFPDHAHLLFVVSYKQKYVHELLVNRLFKFVHEKSVVRWTDLTNMTITVYWDEKQQNRQTKLFLIPIVIKIFVLPNFEWTFYTGFTVQISHEQGPLTRRHRKLTNLRRP